MRGYQSMLKMDGKMKKIKQILAILTIIALSHTTNEAMSKVFARLRTQICRSAMTSRFANLRTAFSKTIGSKAAKFTQHSRKLITTGPLLTCAAAAAIATTRDHESEQEKSSNNENNPDKQELEQIEEQIPDKHSGLSAPAFGGLFGGATGTAMAQILISRLSSLSSDPSNWKDWLGLAGRGFFLGLNIGLPIGKVISMQDAYNYPFHTSPEIVSYFRLNREKFTDQTLKNVGLNPKQVIVRVDPTLSSSMSDPLSYYHLNGTMYRTWPSISLNREATRLLVSNDATKQKQGKFLLAREAVRLREAHTTKQEILSVCTPILVTFLGLGLSSYFNSDSWGTYLAVSLGSSIATGATKHAFKMSCEKEADLEAAKITGTQEAVDLVRAQQQGRHPKDLRSGIADQPQWENLLFKTFMQTEPTDQERIDYLTELAKEQEAQKATQASINS